MGVDISFTQIIGPCNRIVRVYYSALFHRRLCQVVDWALVPVSPCVGLVVGIIWR